MNGTRLLTQRLEKLLEDGLSAEGADLESKLRRVGHELPDDLLSLLHNLTQLRTGVENGEADCLEFAFLCGQAYERLENTVQSRLAATIAFHAPDGSPPLELDKKDFDKLALFVAMRDRLLRTVADYTLKFLLVSVVLLVIGLSLGLI